ncbi:MAG: ABC transporter substrate-binding protein [Halanaerobiales bacterium]
MKRIITLVLVLTFVLSLSLVSLANEVELLDPYVSDMPQGQWGGTLITTMVSDPNTFNPVLSGDSASDEIFEARIFEALAMVNPISGKYEPALARKWETSEDGLTWTFYLRRGIQWSDGEEFTADDVIFTYDVTMDEEVNSPARDGLFIKGEPIEYRKIDKYTVEFTTPEPFAPFLSTMQYIIPEHKLADAYENGQFNETWGVDTSVEEIVGTGPMILAQYRPAQRVVYMRNSKYWKKAPNGQSLPYITRWVNEIVPNTDSALLNFENGTTHMTGLLPQDYERIKANEGAGNYTVHEAGTSFTSTLITFNMNQRNPDFKEHPWKNKWFRNIHFRRALNHATDRETIADQIYAGKAVPQWSPVNAANKFWINEDVKKYPFDLDTARAELKAGGFTWDEDDNLIGPEGNPVKINLLTTETSDPWVDMMNIISSDYEKLGIDVNTQPVAFSNLIERLTNSYEWDMIIIGWGGGGTELYGGYTMWLSDAPYHMWNPELEEPEFEWEARIDEIWDLAATTLDTEERKEYYDEWQMIYSEELPLLYSVNVLTFTAVTNELQNVRASSLGGDLYNGSVTWDISNLYFE